MTIADGIVIELRLENNNMKKSVLFSAIAIGLYYLVRELLAKEETKPEPPKKHLTNAFSKAKARVVEANEQG